MSADDCLQAILRREAVDTGLYSPVRGVQTVLAPIIRAWAGAMFLSLQPSGSFVKGTANKSGTGYRPLHLDLREQVPDTLREIYQKLARRLRETGYTPTLQNVSVKITVNGYAVDLVPGKRQNAYDTDHSLYRRKADTWTKTNVDTHITRVIAAGLQPESRVLKLWRDQKRLDFPSFYLELTVINALAGRYGTLSANVWAAFQYLAERFPNTRVVDPTVRELRRGPRTTRVGNYSLFLDASTETPVRPHGLGANLAPADGTPVRPVQA